MQAGKIAAPAILAIVVLFGLAAWGLGGREAPVAPAAMQRLTSTAPAQPANPAKSNLPSNGPTASPVAVRAVPRTDARKPVSAATLAENILPACPDLATAGAAANTPVTAACAIAALRQICAGAAAAQVPHRLADYLGTHLINVRKGLARYNVLNFTDHASWCDLPEHARETAMAIAMTPKKSPNLQRAEANRDYLLWTLSDADGSINPGGYAEALEMRRQVVAATMAGTGGKAPAQPSSPQKIEAVNPALPSQPLTAGLPATPAGWTNLSGYTHPVGRINDLLIDNVGTTTTRTMWAGTDGGGIWKTTDGGTTWAPVNDFNGSLAIGKVLRSPRNATDMYASTNPFGSHTYSPFGILKSTNGGVTWTQLAQTSPAGNSDWQYVTHLAIHPAGVAGQDVLLAATNNGAGGGGVYQSTDSGATWAKISANAIANYVGFHPADGNRRAYALNDGNISVTTTGTWPGTTSTILAGTAQSYTKFAFAASDVNIMYALVSVGGNTNLMRSATGGSTWAAVTPPTNFFFNSGYLYYTGNLWVDPTNPNRIVMLEALAASTPDATAGASIVWSQSNNYWIDHHGAVADPGYNGSTNKIVYTMDDGGLYRFNDVDSLSGGSYLATGMTITEAYSVAGRGGNLVLGAQDVGARYYRTAVGDAAQKWRLPSGPGIGDGADTAADPTNPNILYGANQYQRLNRSTDGGATTVAICQNLLDSQCSGFTHTVNAAFIAPFILDPNTPTTMLAGGGSLWRSTDVSTAAAPAWTQIHTGVASVVVAIAVAKTDSNIIWVAYQNGTVYKTANGLSATPTWTQVATVPAGNKQRIYIDRTNAQRVYLGLTGFTGNKLYATSDGGGSWSALTGLPAATVFAIEAHPANPSWLYVGTAVGLFASQDGGATWGASNEGPANVQVRDLGWYSETGNSADLLVATFGRGIWRTTVITGSGPLLTVSKAGAGSGSVVSVPAGINCGLSCSNTFAAASTVTLTATPDASSTFAGWSGGGCSGTGTCTVTMSGAQNVTATFNLLPEVFPVGCAVPAGWSTPVGATAGWAVASDRKRTGTCSLKSAPISSSNVNGVFTKAQIQATGTFAAGSLTFYYNVSSEAGWDCLRLLVDGVQRAEVGSTCTNYGGAGASGDISTWTLVTVPVTAGAHTFTWSYEKDYTVDSGIDAAWIDDVVLPPLAGAGTLQFSSATQSVGEGAGTVSIPVTRTGGSTGAVSVTYVTANGTATAGADYTAATGTLNWADSDSAAKNVVVAILPDALVEGAENFTVTLSAPVGAALGAQATTTITINDSVAATVPGAPVIGVVSPGNGQASVNFTAPLSNGGAAITSYTASCTGGTSTPASGTTSPLTVTGMTNGVTYSCSVTATNSIGTGPASSTATVTPQANPPLALTGVVLRRAHPVLGNCDIDVNTGVPIGGAVTVEPRVIGAGHEVVFKFNNNVLSPGTVSVVDATPAPIGTPSVFATGNEVKVTIAGIADRTRATVSLSGVTGAVGTVSPAVAVGFLLGDVSNSRAVSAADIAAVKARASPTLTAQNCRFDLNVNGGINASDVSVVKARSGVPLP